MNSQIHIRPSVDPAWNTFHWIGIVVRRGCWMSRLELGWCYYRRSRNPVNAINIYCDESNDVRFKKEVNDIYSFQTSIIVILTIDPLTSSIDSSRRWLESLAGVSNWGGGRLILLLRRRSMDVDDVDGSTPPSTLSLPVPSTTPSLLVVVDDDSTTGSVVDETAARKRMDRDRTLMVEREDIVSNDRGKRIWHYYYSPLAWHHLWQTNPSHPSHHASAIGFLIGIGAEHRHGVK